MTLDELRGLVQQFYSPEELASFERAVDLFDRLELEFLDQFDILIGNYYTGSETDCIDAIKATFHGLANQLVSMHGITLDDEVQFHQVLNVLEVLLALPNWENTDRLEDICNQDINPEEKFIDLMEEITANDCDDFLPLLESVNPALFDRIKEQSSQDADDVENTMAIEETIRYMALRGKIDIPELWADRYMLINGLAVADYASIFKLWLADKSDLVNNAVTQFDYRAIACELIALACVSSEGLSKAIELFEEHQDELYRDTSRAMVLSGVMRNVFMELNRG